MIFSVLSIIMQKLLYMNVLGRINSEYLYDDLLVIVWCSLIFALFCRIDMASSRLVFVVCNNCFGVFMIHEFF